MARVPKTAIVTGASSGIGRTTAIALLVAGWNVVLTARREEALKETANMADRPSNTLIVIGDVTDEAFAKDLFAKTVAHFGRLDLLFNNAGISAPQVPIDELPLAVFQQIINVNLIGPFLCTREAVKVFKAQSPPGGRIINNGSLSAHIPRPHSSPYTCSKHAIMGLTKCTSLDGRAHNITCTQIDIGNAHTKMAAGHVEGALQPDGRMVAEPTMDVMHVADSIVHIANLPNDVTVLEYKIMPSSVPFVGRG
ncbi:putative alcohol dehydrogenase (NAD) activity [Lyophyllum shimeji]|uniref:Alcohol dehydrogenase (NAD) activity n=1 Tax=Lyophyllum shimeji TaxID=47721 RepID=A0A9P3PLG1_LYOSH|nr:putative alcohol dehydrogenase (NAD) activity [Lyophyllum shimeji]